MEAEGPDAGKESSSVPELRNSSYDSFQDEFCSPNKSSVENSVQYLHQVRSAVEQNEIEIHLDRH